MIEIEAEGLESAMALMETLNTKPQIKGITCNTRDRLESNGVNNRQIMEWLAERGRDFFSINDMIVRELDQTMVKAMEKELDKQLKASIRREKARKRGNYIKHSKKKEANVVATRGFRAAMKRLLQIVNERIDNQVTATGGTPSALSEAYQVEKEFKYGFTIPIGVATGQLRDNIVPGNRNIKLTR